MTQLFASIVEIMHKRYDTNEDYRELVMPSKSSFLLQDNGEETGTKPDSKKKKGKSKEEGGCC